MERRYISRMIDFNRKNRDEYATTYPQSPGIILRGGNLLYWGVQRKRNTHAHGHNPSFGVIKWSV
ncbi:MAG: hypothetical protein A4E38_00080 [Methanoregulaceae archaeon PtaB.Bin108]|nr:MAG: hypothetical protein A4E38_00080 [Methanoregulaceae archaeon PtaB.Bin108]